VEPWPERLAAEGHGAERQERETRGSAIGSGAVFLKKTSAEPWPERPAAEGGKSGKNEAPQNGVASRDRIALYLWSLWTASSVALEKTASSISSVSFPVKVFCWLG